MPVRSPFPWQFDCRAAVTVNVVVPGGVAPVVATVSDVLGLSPLVPVRLVLPNVAVAPAGSPLALKSRVHVTVVAGNGNGDGVLRARPRGDGPAPRRDLNRLRICVREGVRRNRTRGPRGRHAVLGDEPVREVELVGDAAGLVRGHVDVAVPAAARVVVDADVDRLARLPMSAGERDLLARSVVRLVAPDHRGPVGRVVRSALAAGTTLSSIRTSPMSITPARLNLRACACICVSLLVAGRAGARPGSPVSFVVGRARGSLER